MSRKYCSVLMLFHCIPNSLLDHGLIFDSRCRKSISFCTEPFDHWTNNLELQQGLEPQEFDFTNPDDDDHTCFLWRFSRLHFQFFLGTSGSTLLMTKGFLVTCITLDTLCTPFEEHCCTVPWEHSDTGFVVPEIL